MECKCLAKKKLCVAGTIIFRAQFAKSYFAQIKEVGISTGIFVPWLRAATNLQICEVGHRFKSVLSICQPVVCD